MDAVSGQEDVAAVQVEVAPGERGGAGCRWRWHQVRGEELGLLLTHA